ncbi:MAG: flagellin B, partial [Campylobacterota bacterium]|nr:flagellin B [Campylobacterota bacterium]
RINTNIAAMNAHTNAVSNNTNMDSSLQKLSSGLRINSAADDASGLTIADSLRSQANTLGQAIKNANDGISIVQIADKAMDEQVKILDTIKVKATQAAQDGQNLDSRKALQADITRLMEELDNIAGTTSYNGQNLLSGQFTNKEFQIGAYSNQTISASIGATSSDKIGNTRFETSQTITGSSNESLTFTVGDSKFTLESVIVSTSAGTGIGVLAEVINKNSDLLGGIQASFDVQTTGTASVSTGTISSLSINGISIGDVKIDDANDSQGVLVDAINNYSADTGVVASTDSRGRLELTSNDGRAIQISGASLSSITGIGASNADFNAGRLSLTRVGASDIQVSGSGATTATGHDMTNNLKTNAMEESVNLRDTKGSLTTNQASAMGFNANANVVGVSGAGSTGNVSGGVTSMAGAQAVMKIADSALKRLDQVRSDLGAVQNQLQSTINNISVTQVNVASAESQIRDVDFAAESANFSKLNILAQSGSYAMSQANAMQQNVLRLLQ